MTKRTPKPPAMTGLPPSMLEAEAIDYARQHIAFVRDGKLKLFGVVPGRWFESDESRRACRLMMRDLILSDATHLMDAVAFARAGFEFFEQTLRELILEFQNRGPADDMPVYLAGFAMELTRGIRYSKRSGRHRDDDMLRDLIIGIIVGKVVERFNLRPRRNAVGHRPSACSVVARALSLENMAMSESNVAHCWQAMPRIVGKTEIITMN